MPPEAAQPPKKSRAGLVIGIFVGMLALCGLCAVAGTVGYLRFMPVRNVITEIQAPGEPASADAPGSVSTEQVKAFETPEKAVEAFYEAFSFDREAPATLFDTTPDLRRYANGAPSGYHLLEPVVAGGRASLDVEEQEVPDGTRTIVMFRLRKGDDGWHLASVGLAATDD